MIFPSLTLSIIKLVFLGTLLWLFFFFLKRGAKLLLSEKPYKRTIDDTLFYIKITSWVVFIFWSADTIFKGQPLMSRAFVAILFCLLIGLSWSLIRDIFSGILIRTEGLFTINSHIKSHGVEGLVRKLGYRALEIETERGETVRIPYSIIDKEITIRSYPIESIKSHTFEIVVNKSNEFLDYKEKIKKALLNNHYTSLRKNPVVKVKADTNGKYQLLVTAYILDDRYFEKVEQSIKAQFEHGKDMDQPPVIPHKN